MMSRTRTFILTFAITYVVVFGADGLFHVVIARGFFDSHLPAAMAPVEQWSLVFPALEKLLIVAGTMAIALSARWSLVRVAAVGAYCCALPDAAWHLLNLGGIEGWSAVLAGVDVVWHVALGAAGGVTLYLVWPRLRR